MAILSFTLESIGQAGQQPTIVRFNTNDSIATVTTAGFLNHFVEQGNGVSESQIALVITRETPASSPAVNFYNIVFSGGNWSLVAN